MNNTLFTNTKVSSQRIIYTPSTFARTNLLYLQEIGTLQSLTLHISSRSGLPSYLFFIVTEGSGELTYNNTIYSLSKGDCVFIDCKKPYSHCSTEELWKLKWCHFFGNNLSGIYKKYIERGGYCVFHPDNIIEYVQLLDELYNLADSTIYTRDMRIYEKLSTLITLIMEESWHPERQDSSVIPKQNILDIKSYIDTCYKEHLTLESLSNMFFINKYYLARCFKEQCGMTVTSYIQQVRITKAKQLLRFSHDSIENISMECGIPDANYFSRIFKKIEGITPGEYRKMWKGK